MNILAVHGDHVARVPEGAVIQASSVRTPVEVYSIGNRILCA